ncbi:MAG: hypothetical protein AAF589_05430 [Planctomycetota bacterium]
MKAVFALAISLSLFAGNFSEAMVVYDESLSGDLASDFTSPTPLSYSTGENTVIGQFGANGDGGVVFGPSGNDVDRFTFTVPAGAQIISLTVDAFVASDDIGFGSLIAYVDASAFASDTDNVSNILFNAGSGEILPSLAGGPLGPGDYSFWLQETALSTIDYQLTFTQIMPEPSALGLVSILVAGLIRQRR